MRWTAREGKDMKRIDGTRLCECISAALKDLFGIAEVRASRLWKM